MKHTVHSAILGEPGVQLCDLNRLLNRLRGSGGQPPGKRWLILLSSLNLQEETYKPADICTPAVYLPAIKVEFKPQKPDVPTLLHSQLMDTLLDDDVIRTLCWRLNA